MPTLTLPAIVPPPATMEFSLQANTQSSTSPLSRATQTREIPGPRWSASLQYAPLQDESLHSLRAFLSQLRGASGRFYLHDYGHPSPAGVATGTPAVKGGSQTGSTLITDGWTVSTAGILKAGDYIGVNGELKIVVTDANSDVNGNATLSIEPPLRASPPDNSLLVLTKPTCIMRLVDDNQARWAWRPGILGNIAFDCIEVF